MKRGVSVRMLAGFGVELGCFALAAMLSRDRPVVVALFFAGFLMAVALSIALSNQIAAVARELAAAARGLAAGEVDQEITVRRDDDLGRIGDAFRDMVAYQGDMARVADAISRGDLTAEIEPKSEHDVFGHAFSRMRAALRRQVDELERVALFDSLTGLPNRALLRDRLRQAVRTGRRRKQPFALLLLDLDRFKEVNDTFGHDKGDELLEEAARRLGGCLREADTLARLGGDEFAVLIPDADAAAAVAVADRMTAALRRTFVLDAHGVEVTGSIGIVVCPEHAKDVDTLIRRADVAMYQAKKRNMDCALYDPALDHHSPERVAMVGDLRRAIAGDELVLHYQPQLDYAAGRVTSVEALVRWEHPERGLVPPDEFIGLAEQTGLIGELTAWVLRAAIPQAAAWQAEGLPVAVSVNLSARNLRDPGLADLVAGLLGSAGLGPSRLLLEITESALMQDPTQALATLQSLRSLGLSVAVDDYGTGYSSLSYLKQLPLHELKIDRSFVRHLTKEADDLSIVRSTIGLAHELGLRVVAEGVEDDTTLQLLATLGCDLAQGYHLSRPIPAVELTRWLRASPYSPAVNALR